MKNLLRISFYFLITSCATIPEIPPTDPVLIPYIEMYEEDKGEEISIPVYFQTQPFGIAGSCKSYVFRSGGIKVIQIDPTEWNSIPELQKRALLYHEMGHCDLGRNHNEERFPDGCPKSLMYEAIIFNGCLEKQWENYVDELFSR